MSTLVAFLVSALLCAVNVVIYVSSDSPVSLGAAIFCGLCALFNAVMAVDS